MNWSEIFHSLRYLLIIPILLLLIKIGPPIALVIWAMVKAFFERCVWELFLKTLLWEFLLEGLIWRFLLKTIVWRFLLKWLIWELLVCNFWNLVDFLRDLLCEIVKWAWRKFVRFVKWVWRIVWEIPYWVVRFIRAIPNFVRDFPRVFLEFCARIWSLLQKIWRPLKRWWNNLWEIYHECYANLYSGDFWAWVIAVIVCVFGSALVGGLLYAAWWIYTL